MFSTAAGTEAGKVPGLPRHDTANSCIPRYAVAVLEALRFGNAGDSRLRNLSEAEFRKALEFCDKAQLTLILNHICRDALPPWAQARIEANLRNYSVRFDRLKQSLFEITDLLESLGTEFVVLKGLTHSPDFTPDPLLRAQGDIDIWCEPGKVIAARDALLQCGYRSAGPSQRRHLPPLIRETHWEWRGDYHASDLPIPVELHYQLWDEKAESVPMTGESEFWARRVTASFDGRRLPVLSKPDTLAFASLHLLMHLLHGDLRLQRAWEIANFLHIHAHDAAFWHLWQGSHSDSLRRLEAIVFQLVSDWFDSDLAETVGEEIDLLPGEVKLWIERYALSPIEVPFRPNKDELWLHLALVESAHDRRVVFFRRILPMRPPARVDESTLNKTPSNAEQRKRRLSFLGARARHHCQTLLPALVGGLKWNWMSKGPEPGFVLFQAASALLSLGMFIFLLLYNLRLLEIGFQANLIGRVAGFMSLGTFVGALSAAAITRRLGLRKAILIAILGSAAGMVLRVLSVQEGWLMATSLMHGTFLALWMVSFSPAVAALTTERNRQFAFSLACSAGVCVGIVGGLAGGRLPGLLRSLVGTADPTDPNRMALWVAAGIVALAAWPAARLRFPVAPRVEAKVYPRGRFMAAFLVCLGLWSVAVGAFNPFFNAFFAERLRMSVERIGIAFAFSHAGQVTALLCAPLVLRWLGQVRGIAYMQLASGMALICLALSSGGGVATVSYVSYMSFQYMSEPGVFSMLMSRVAPGERSGASALYLLVTSISASVGALTAGSAVVRFGYPSVLVASAVVAAVASVLFRVLVGKQASEITAATSC
ncbi:MAG TPA: MFS transporter [Bryobacteraceae bacterium]|nr:MFS transporter [Bryobacteraceae bacterium]